MDKVAVLIPCYNEAKTIKKVVEDFKKELPEAKIYVYDNNSKDGTDKIAKEAGAIVKYETRQGKGNVIRTMFREIDAECYIMVDGDDTYPAESAKEMVKAVLEEDVDIRYIQQLLGHSSILTTQIYTHVSGAKQRDILTNKHPRNRLTF